MLGTSTPHPPDPRPRPNGPRWPAILAFALAVGVSGSLAQAQSPKPARDPAKDEFGQPIHRAGFVDRLRSDGPEWLAMVAELLAGGQAAPGRGWYEQAVSKTRFGWDDVVKTYDRDGNRSVARAEYPGPDGDFKRLDRDRNGRLTRFDFEFPANALYRSRSRMLMSFADSNRDGKVATNEYNQMIYMGYRDEYTRVRFFSESIEDVEAAYKASEKAGIPFLSLADLRATVDMAAVLKRLDGPTNLDGDVEKADRKTLLKALARGELGSLRVGPDLGDQAPDFTLQTDDGKGQVTLSKLLGSKPVVLAFGSLTDGVFRSDAGSLEKLARLYKGRAEFLMVYVREARPSDGWASPANAKAGLSLPQPKDARGRMQLARDLRKKLGLGFPIVVDSLDDRVGILYSGLPDRLYLLDPRGRVVYKGGRGPFGFKPDELEPSLILQLQADSAPAAGPGTPAGR